MKRLPPRLSVLVVAVYLSSSWCAHAQVRISEISYNPDGDDDVEYVELYNSSAEPVDLLGWSFVEGIRYSFRESLRLAPASTLVLARDPTALSAEYGDTGLVVRFEGHLDNGGESLRLVNGLGRTVDALRYDDEFPFPPDADGDGNGAVLELACLARPTAAPFNWRAGAPTPGRHEDRAECARQAPRRDPEAFPIVIHEIHYHPAGDPAPPLEYVELLNRGVEAVDLSLWAFDRGIGYEFPAGTRLAPGEFLLVAQDPAALALEFTELPAAALGPFADQTELSNSGETLRLVDALGKTQDRVLYGEDGGWPAFADGLGGSLQRVDPYGPSAAPGNWRVAPLAQDEPEWRTIRVDGTQQGSRIQFVLGGAGAFLLDDVSLVTVEDGTESVANGDFSGMLEGWESPGGYERSEWQAAGGYGDDGPCMLVRSNGTISTTDAFQQRLATRPPRGALLNFTFRFKFVSGSRRIVARSSLGSPVNGGVYWKGDVLQDVTITPGAPNVVSNGPTPKETQTVTGTPPSLELAERWPAWPTSGDEVTVVARVEARDVEDVTIMYRVGDGSEQSLPLRDDGVASDQVAGDGLWTVRLPPAPDQSLVWFSLRATTLAGASTLWPRWRNPAPVTGYYVVDELPATNEYVHLFYMFTPGALEDLSCAEATYREGAVVDPTGKAYFAAGLKFRGETACGYTKRPLRVRFNKGDRMDGRSRMNFMAGWQDKGIMRVKTGLDLFRDATVPYPETNIVRVHTNEGAFHGTYAMVEDPRPDYLARNQRDAEGGLYKARTAMLDGSTAGYEPRTDTSEQLLEAVGEFATGLNALEGDALIDHLVTQLDVEGMIDYQTVQAIIIDGDSVVKNWLLYYGTDERRPGEPPRIAVFPWDIDLSFGQMYLTTDERHYDIHPLFHTQTYPFVGQGHHGIVNALLERSPGDYFVKAHYGRMWNLLKEKFAPEVLFPKLDAYAAATEEVVVLDLQKWPRTWGERGDDPFFWRDDFRTFIERRFAFLTAFLVEEHDTTGGRRFRYTPPPRVRLTEIHYNPTGSDDEEFVELTNLEDGTLSLADWDLPAVEYTFGADAELGAGETALLARDPAMLRAAYGLESVRIFGPYSGSLANGGEVLRLRDGGAGGRFFPETIDMVVYDDARGWPEAADGEGRSLELTARRADNDPATAWRAGWSPGAVATGNRPPVAMIAVGEGSGDVSGSVLLDATGSADPDGDPLVFRWSLPGGRFDARPVLLLDDPGEHVIVLTVEDGVGGTDRREVSVVLGDGLPRFRRGDVDGDGRTRLLDPMLLLGALFRGEGAVPCQKSADVDDNGSLGVEDAIGLLNYIFRRGPPPTTPFTACGTDPTQDELMCDGACS